MALQRALPLLLYTSLLVGCPGTRDKCSTIPTCGSACCEESRLCEQAICNGLAWVCRKDPASGAYAWVKNAPCEAGDGFNPNLDRGTQPDRRADRPTSDLPTSCGAHASLVGGACKCLQGYVNQDGSWANGCEAPDPLCSVTSCGNCPEGYCGPNAHCLNNVKCRCASALWRNQDGDWSNGCETPSVNCNPQNCNNCYIGYCGPHANCMQNKCECTEAGWTNCDGVWELSGCECNGTCTGGQCK